MKGKRVKRSDTTSFCDTCLTFPLCMKMAGGVFHVEFGINETPLTRALERGNFVTAEKYIRDTVNPSYLDEGCYQRTPLFICLCGMDEEEQRVRPRNMYLAKLLVEHGANVNYRVPTTFFGSEYQGPGQSALELLTDFYNDMTKHRHEHSNALWNAYHCGWDPHVDVVIGLNKQYLNTLEDVIEHVEDVIFVILSNGGDANICDVSRLTALHRTIIYSHDDRLMRLLVENGANANAMDCQGNTPLTALCDISASDMYDYLEDLSPSSDDTLEDTSATLCVKKPFLDFLLSQKDIQVNLQNSRGHTAFFHCVVRGDVDACYKLLSAGADPTIRGTVWETRKKKRKLSSIFATFISIPVQRTLSWQNMHHKLATAPHQYSHLVDAGHFTRKELVEEITGYLEHEFHEFIHLKSLGHKLVTMMFGRTTATLQQLAARRIFQHCFLDGSCTLGKIMPADTLKHRYSNADLKEVDVYDEYVTLGLNQAVLKALVVRLNLPQDSLINLEVELLRHQMASKFSTFKFMQPENMFGSESESSSPQSEDSNSSQDEGDSDLEYW